MKKAGFGWLTASLALGVGAAVSTLLAQAPGELPWLGQEFGPRMRELRILRGHGGQLGVTVADLTADDLEAASGVTSGARIESVEPRSAALKAGIQEGDIVVEFDGERVRSAQQFSRLVRETPANHPVKVTIVRGGQRRTLDVTPDRGMSSMFELDDRLPGEIERGLPRLDRPPSFNFEGRPFRLDPEVGGRSSPRPRGRLGVQLDSLTPQLAEYFGAKDGGVLVSSVTPGSPAEKAGLKAGDVIVSVNGDRVRDVGELRHEIADAPSGELTIGIVRDKTETMIKGTVPQP